MYWRITYSSVIGGTPWGATVISAATDKREARKDIKARYPLLRSLSPATPEQIERYRERIEDAASDMSS
jgi:hypothetical protein